MATRHTLADETYRGGRVTPEAPPKPKPRYPCFAEQCPMAGTIFMHGTDKPGTCVFHYGVTPSDIPKVTRVLLDWQCVAEEVRRARVALTSDIAADSSALRDTFAKAWTRLEAAAPGWEDQLRPQTIKTSKGVDTGMEQNYSDWAKHLERFLGARVVEVLSTNQRRSA